MKTCTTKFVCDWCDFSDEIDHAPESASVIASNKVRYNSVELNRVKFWSAHLCISCEVELGNRLNAATQKPQ